MTDWKPANLTPAQTEALFRGLSKAADADLAKLTQSLPLPEYTPEEERDLLVQELREVEDERDNLLVQLKAYVGIIESLEQQLRWADSRGVRLEFDLNVTHGAFRLSEEENQRLKQQIAELTGDTRKLT